MQSHMMTGILPSFPLSPPLAFVVPSFPSLTKLLPSFSLRIVNDGVLGIAFSIFIDWGGNEGGVRGVKAGTGWIRKKEFGKLAWN